MRFTRAPPQTDGGYLGVDIETFFSSVTSGAPGVFSVTLGQTEALVSDTLPDTLWLGLVISDTPETAPRQQVVSAAMVLMFNLVTDLAYRLVDPRIRTT